MINRSGFLDFQLAFGIASLLSCSFIHAQRPALVRNVDERGRTPYHQYMQGTCAAGTCRFAFKAVPAGFRLVVTHVSLIFQTGANGIAYLSDDPSFNGPAAPDGSTNALVLSPSKIDSTSAFATVSSAVTFYVEPGGIPAIVVSASGTPNASLEGYFVALD